MPLIKPRTRGKQFVRHITRLDRENERDAVRLRAVPGRADRVRAQSADRHVLAKDKEFLAWRADIRSRSSLGERRTGRVPRATHAEPDRRRHTCRSAATAGDALA